MAYEVTVRRAHLRAVLDLKGRQRDIATWLDYTAPDLPTKPNTFSRLGETELLWIGPDHWLLRAPLAREEELLARKVPDAISVAHVSDTFSSFRIAGEDADQVLAIACPLDLHPDAFPKNGATYTEAFGLKALVCRRDDGFELNVERSFGDMLEDYLTRAIGP